MNSALRKIHERRQYRLMLFRAFCEALVWVAAIGAFSSLFVLWSIASQL